MNARIAARNQVHRIAAVLALLLIGWPLAANAGPLTADPLAPFAVRPEPESERLAAEASTAMNEAEKIIADLESRKDRLAAPGFGTIAKDVTKAHLRLLQAERLSERLTIRGEAAGLDFQFRSADARDRLTAFVLAVKSLPGIAARMPTVDQFADRAARQLTPLKKVETLFQKNDLENAETALYKIRDQLEPMIVWFKYADIKPALDPFDKAQGAIQARLVPERRTRAVDEIRATRKQVMPNFGQIESQLAAAAESIGKTGQADVDGRKLSGPQALKDFAAAWRKAIEQALHARSLDWSRFEHDDDARGQVAELERQYAAFAEKMPGLLAALIQADAGRAAEADLAALHVEYVSAVAAVLVDASNVGLTDALTAAVETIPDRSDALKADVELYQAATADLLRWRERTSSAYAAAFSAEHRALDEQFLEAGRGDPALGGLVPGGQATQAGTPSAGIVLADPAPKAVRVLSERMAKSKVLVTDLAGKSPESSASALRSRTLATVPIPAAASSAEAQLRAELMVTDKTPPLTLEAALAAAGAEAGQFEQAGGEISGIELESLLATYARPEKSEPALRLGFWPAEPDPAHFQPLRQVQVRFTLNPGWLRNRYFFLLVPDGVVPPSGSE